MRRSGKCWLRLGRVLLLVENALVGVNGVASQPKNTPEKHSMENAEDGRTDDEVADWWKRKGQEEGEEPWSAAAFHNYFQWTD